MKRRKHTLNERINVAHFRSRSYGSAFYWSKVTAAMSDGRIDSISQGIVSQALETDNAHAFGIHLKDELDETIGTTDRWTVV